MFIWCTSPNKHLRNVNDGRHQASESHGAFCDLYTLYTKRIKNLIAREKEISELFLTPMWDIILFES